MPDVLKAFIDKLNLPKVNYYSITPMEKFAGITTDITIKNHHTWGCPVYVFNAGSKGNIDGLTKWKP